MNSTWAKIGLFAAGVAVGIAAVKLLESDKIIVVSEDATEKLKEAAGQAADAVKNTAAQVKSAVQDKLTQSDKTIIISDCSDESFGE